MVKKLAEKYASQAAKRLDQQMEAAIQQGAQKKQEDAFYSQESDGGKKARRSSGNKASKQNDAQPQPYALSLVPKKNEQQWPLAPHLQLGGETGFSTIRGIEASTSAVYSLSGKESQIGIEPGYYFYQSESKGLADYRNLGIYASFQSQSGYIGTGYRLVEGGVSFGVSSSSGMGLFYGVTGSGKVGWSVNSFGGPAGDTYALAKYLSTSEVGAIGGALSLAKAGVDIIYSLATWASELFAPKIQSSHREANRQTLHALETSENLTIEQCVEIIQSKRGERLGKAYSAEEFQELRQHAAQHLQNLLFVEMFKENAGEQNGLKTQHWEQLLKICNRNSSLFDATLMSELRVHVDTRRLGEQSTKTPGFMQGWGQKSSSGAARVAGDITSSMLSGIFNVQELTLGAPISLRWHGWRIDKTIADTFGGWFENTFAFENTRNGHGLGKVLGAVMDAGGDLLKIASHIIGTVSPIYFRSDARKEHVRKDVMKAMEANEKFLSGTPDWGDKQMLANMLYLGKMLPIVFQGNDRALGGKISQHMVKYGVAYEVLASKIAIAQAGQVAPAIEALDKELSSLKTERQVLKNRLSSGKKSDMEAYRKNKAEYDAKSAQYNALSNMHSDAVRRIGEAYVYLSSVGEPEMGSFKKDAASEIAGMRAFLKTEDPKRLEALDASVEEMADVKRPSSHVLSSMGIVLGAMKDANYNYAAVLEKAENDPALSDAILALESVQKHSLVSSVYRAYMADVFAHGNSGLALQAQQSISSSFENAVQQIDRISDAIKDGAKYEDIKPKILELYDQLRYLSSLAVLYPAEYSQDYRNRLDRELHWIMNKLPSKLPKKVEKRNAAFERFELAYVICSSGALSPDSQSYANKQMRALGIDNKGSEYYNALRSFSEDYSGISQNE
ncbi:MAG: hypothetical protein WCY41_05650 [Candidatus Micrarchaeia archaeon]